MAWFIILYILTFALMTISVILFETNSKKIIFWCLVFSCTWLLGYLFYILFFSDRGCVNKALILKSKEDKIYKSLVNFSLNSNESDSQLINFARQVYDANSYKNSTMEIIDKNENFNTQILNDIELANNFIIIDTYNFLNGLQKDAVVTSLIEKQKMGVPCKVVYGKAQLKDRKLIKQLKLNKVRCCKFKKGISQNRLYKNTKNIISIDGEVGYIFSNFKEPNKRKNYEIYENYYKFTGDILKEIKLQAYMDLSFATRKFYPVKDTNNKQINSKVEYLYIGSSIENNLLDLLLKAIIGAKDNITIHVDKFIPTESILEAIKLAVKSDVKVRLMISSASRRYGYYTSRSYVKELAREGVVCYYFDGQINSNYITIDNQITLIGNLSLEGEKLIKDLQDVMIINDSTTAKDFNLSFNKSINNSYKLCNPKRVLFREKFFRKFM